MAFYLPDPRWEEPRLLTPGMAPLGEMAIDHSHPQARDLWFYLNLKATDGEHKLLTGRPNADGFMPLTYLNPVDAHSNPYYHPVMGECRQKPDDGNLANTTEIEITSTADVTPIVPTDPFTVAFDFVSHDTNTGSVVSFHDDSTGAPLLLFTKSTADVLRWFINGGYRGNVTTPQDEVGRHMLTFDGAECRSYLNGVKNFTYTTSTMGTNDSKTVFFGNGFNGSRDGLYGNAGFWLRSFSDGEALDWARNPYGMLVPA